MSEAAAPRRFHGGTAEEVLKSLGTKKIIGMSYYIWDTRYVIFNILIYSYLVYIYICIYIYLLYIHIYIYIVGMYIIGIYQFGMGEEYIFGGKNTRYVIFNILIYLFGIYIHVYTCQGIYWDDISIAILDNILVLYWDNIGDNILIGDT